MTNDLGQTDTSKFKMTSLFRKNGHQKLNLDFAKEIWNASQLQENHCLARHLGFHRGSDRQ